MRRLTTKNPIMKTSGLLLCSVLLLFASCLEEPNQHFEESRVYQEPDIIDTAEMVVTFSDGSVADPGHIAEEERIAKGQETEVVYQTIKYEKPQLDSMAEIAPIYNAGEYDKLAVEMYFSLSKATGGKVHLVKDADAVVSTIYDIIDNYVYVGTDLVIVMDRTYSMWDDIDKVKNSLEVIIDKLRKMDNVRLGMATFTDLNHHGDYWYYSTDLTTDLEAVRDFMRTTTILSNSDTPESANDAVMRTIEEMDWMPGNKRVMMLIGDAPSQLPPMGNYSLEDVISKCTEDEIAMNIHPVVLAIDKTLKTPGATAEQDMIMNIYPNPVSVEGTIEFYASGSYEVEIFDASQNLVLNNSYNGEKVTMNFSELSTGMYLLRVHDNSTDNYAAKLFAVSR